MSQFTVKLAQTEKDLQKRTWTLRKNTGFASIRRFLSKQSVTASCFHRTYVIPLSTLSTSLCAVNRKLLMKYIKHYHKAQPKDLQAMWLLLKVIIDNCNNEAPALAQSRHDTCTRNLVEPLCSLSTMPSPSASAWLHNLMAFYSAGGLHNL